MGKSTMRFMTLVAVALAVSLIAPVVESRVDYDEEEDPKALIWSRSMSRDDVNSNAQGTHKRRDLVLPPMFSWDKFRQVYKRTYGYVDTVWRSAVYLAHCVKIFFHNVLYSSEVVGYYLAVNSLADMTEKEISEMFPPLPEHSRNNVSTNDAVRPTEESAIDQQGIQTALNKIINDKRPGYELLVEAMGKNNVSANDTEPHNIVQRDTSDTIRHPRLRRKVVDDLRVTVYEYDRRLVHNVKPNNPSYEIPMVMSQSRSFQSRPITSELNQVKASYDKADKFVEREWQEVERKLRTSPVHSPCPRTDEQTEKSEEKLTVDWRRCMTPIKHQGVCGSCSYFAVVALLEFEYCRQRGNIVQFSEQYLLDCGLQMDSSRFSGCSGASLSHMNLLVLAYGLETQLLYPYEGKEGLCAYSRSIPAHKRGRIRLLINSHKYWHRLKTEMIDEILQDRPIVVGMNVPDDFQFYGGGEPHTGHNCREDRGHSMLIIGSGVWNDGTPYYVMRNSHGLDYGESGHFKIAKKAFQDNCLVSLLSWELTFKK